MPSSARSSFALGRRRSCRPGAGSILTGFTRPAAHSRCCTQASNTGTGTPLTHRHRHQAESGADAVHAAQCPRLHDEARQGPLLLLLLLLLLLTGVRQNFVDAGPHPEVNAPLPAAA